MASPVDWLYLCLATGYRVPTMLAAIKLAKGLGVELGELVDGVEYSPALQQD